MSSETLKEFGASTSELIQKAASILDEEVAAGMVAAKQVETYVREDGEFPVAEFDEIMQRLRTDAHDFVSIVSQQINELRSGEYDDLAGRFQKDAHDAVDIILNVMKLAPKLIDRLPETEKTS